jgi:transcriptional regulator with XRE-family HTH domain
MSQSRHNQLADFLRSRRLRLSPEAVGLKKGSRRRTPGLRREEVAELAGIGVDWYIRLEQGRSVTPSLATIDALARALRLSQVEQAHLRELTEHGDRRRFERERVPAAVRRIVNALEQPAYITGRRWDVLAFNAAADALFGFSALPEAERNSLIFVLTTASARRLFGAAWADEAQRMVAQFRATHDLWAGDPAFRDLLDRLQRGSPDFSRWWQAHDIRTPRAGMKRLHLADGGVLRCQYASFQANDDPALKLVIFVPV